MNETSVFLDPSKTKIVVTKNVTCKRITSKPGKENITVLMACSVMDSKIVPLIIFKETNIWMQLQAAEGTEFPDYHYADTARGWLENEVFERSFVSAIGKDWFYCSTMEIQHTSAFS